MKEKYYLNLGKNSLLSIAEIVNVFEDIDIVELINDEILVIETSRLFEDNFIDKLGGLKKVSKHLDIIPIDTNQDVFIRDLAQIVSNILQAKDITKVNLGINYFGLKLPVKRIGMEIKNILKSKNFNVRAVNNNNKNLNSVSIKKNKLISKKGIDLNIIKKDNQLIVAKTIGCQNSFFYSNRDFGRPRRNAKVGMLPPKLTQIMLNLSKLKENGNILDPFCGLGTVGQEALLFNQTPYLSDIDADIISDSQANLSWFLHKFMRESKIDLSDKIKVFDAKHIDKAFPQIKFDSIVTEGTLGPPQSYVPNKEKIEKIFKDLSRIYTDFFANAKKILKKGSRIVISFPCIRTNGEKIFFSDTFIKNIENDYEIVKILKKDLINTISLIQSNSPRLLYERSDQIVLREIMVLEPK